MALRVEPRATSRIASRVRQGTKLAGNAIGKLCRRCMMNAFNKKGLTIVGPVLVSALLFGGCATHHGYHQQYQARRVVYIAAGPPEPAVEAVTISPGAGYVWIPGHHRWDRDRYVWVSGSWRAAPVGRTLWIAGRWEQSPR